MNLISQMLLLQQKLNDETNGKNWEQGVTKNGKRIDWKRCAYLECAELIESYPWKHWKNIDASPDYDNIKIEAVDIWHFIMSQMLQEYTLKNLGDIESLSSTIESLPNFKEFAEAEAYSHLDYYDEIRVVEDLMRVLICHESRGKIMEAFIAVAIQSDLNLESLYRLYIGKNILNRFRQDHGYKDGSYIKIWSGEEDNIAMQQILRESPSISPEELYRKLEDVYPAKVMP